MSLWLFAEAISEDRPIDLYNEGRHRRDFTYIDDVVDAITTLLEYPATPSPDFDALSPVPDTSDAPFRIYNIGNDSSVELLRYVELIEESLGKTAQRNLLPKQPGDVEASLADIEPIRREIGWSPSTSIEEGVPKFIEWFKEWRDRS
jgi:UDP-glucuronate 4-epimerase